MAKKMKTNEEVADFGVLNNFFRNEVSPEEFLDVLTDVVGEYSRLSVADQNLPSPIRTAILIDMLGIFHRSLRSAIR